MSIYTIPVPFAMAPYGIHAGDTYKYILETQGASSNAADFIASGLLTTKTTVLDPVKYELHDDDKPEIGHYLASVQSMQQNLGQVVSQNWSRESKFLIIGGDHTISIGTGYGLSKVTDLSKVGLIWVDAHADSNTPETSGSKSITGYPVATLHGLGPSELVDPFASNFIQKAVFIGIRDVDETETKNLQKMGSLIFTPQDIELKGLAKCLFEAMEFLSDTESLWLSIDVDGLDPLYFSPGEVDLPVAGGLTPREAMAIADFFVGTGKLKVTELAQLNDLGKDTILTSWASRVLELAAGLGGFRYGY
jgi:arginase